MDIFWQIQIAITLWLQSLGSWLVLPMKLVSFLGQEEFFIMIIPAIYWCIDPGLGLRLGIMLVTTSGLNSWLKLAFQAPRPYWIDRRVAAFAIETSFGMPSGHSQSAISMWGLAAWKRHIRWLVWLAGAVIVLTGISRIYLGVHSLDQVLVGWLVGAILVWSVVRLDRPVRTLLNKLSLASILLAVTAISLGMVAITLLLGLAAGPIPADWIANAQAAAPQDSFNPYDPSGLIALAGVLLGLGCGAAWEWRRHGPLESKGSWQRRVGRYVLGLVGLLVIYLGLKAVFPGGQDLIGLVFRYIRYGLVGLWVSAFAPAIFRLARLV